QTSRNFLFNCLPIMIIGFLIKKHSLDKKVKVTFLHVLLLICGILIESYLNFTYINNNEPLDFLILLPITVFIIFIYAKNFTIYTKSKLLSSLSIGVYLIHPFIILVVHYLCYKILNVRVYFLFEYIIVIALTL